MILEIP